MKLLLAYDGSRNSEAAIDGLSSAGLPQVGMAKVVSVAEVRLPPAEAIDSSHGSHSRYVESVVKEHREKGERSLAEASIRAKHAEGRVKFALPLWEVSSQALCGSPNWEILTAAEEFSSDLIVVGSHGHTGLSRLVLGSISHTVLTEAKCSVRVSRGKDTIDPAPARVVIGFDGSKGSTAAVDAVASRDWVPGTKVRLLSVVEPISPSGISRFMPPVRHAVDEINVMEDHWIAELARPALEELRAAGVYADFRMHSGDPKQLLVREAEMWGADCIFVGANAWGGRISRILLGSTASAIAARAHCSVEVVRTRETNGSDRCGDA